MMRSPLFLAVVIGVLAQASFAGSRVQDYDVTQIGQPGSGHYVFCSAETCPEPTIKHLAVSAPVVPENLSLPVSPAAEGWPQRASTVPIVKRHTSHSIRTRHVSHVAKVPNRALCTPAGPGVSTSKQPAAH